MGRKSLFCSLRGQEILHKANQLAVVIVVVVVVGPTRCNLNALCRTENIKTEIYCLQWDVSLNLCRLSPISVVIFSTLFAFFSYTTIVENLWKYRDMLKYIISEQLPPTSISVPGLSLTVFLFLCSCLLSLLAQVCNRDTRDTSGNSPVMDWYPVQERAVAVLRDARRGFKAPALWAHGHVCTFTS